MYLVPQQGVRRVQMRHIQVAAYDLQVDPRIAALMHDRGELRSDNKHQNDNEQNQHEQVHSAQRTQ